MSAILTIYIINYKQAKNLNIGGKHKNARRKYGIYFYSLLVEEVYYIRPKTEKS